MGQTNCSFHTSCCQADQIEMSSEENGVKPISPKEEKCIEFPPSETTYMLRPENV